MDDDLYPPDEPAAAEAPTSNGVAPDGANADRVIVTADDDDDDLYGDEDGGGDDGSAGAGDGGAGYRENGDEAALEEDDDDEESDEDVEIVIGDANPPEEPRFGIKPALELNTHRPSPVLLPSSSRSAQQLLNIKPGQAHNAGDAPAAAPASGTPGGPTAVSGGPGAPGSMGQAGTPMAGPTRGGVDLNTIGQLDGRDVFDADLDSLEDKPWRRPGADLTDYFNFGFNEPTWRAYCAKQKQIREEMMMQKRIHVFEHKSDFNPMMPHDPFFMGGGGPGMPGDMMLMMGGGSGPDMGGVMGGPSKYQRMAAPLPPGGGGGPGGMGIGMNMGMGMGMGGPPPMMHMQPPPQQQQQQGPRR
ncbi:pre-mRNA 3-end-processing factor fip1l1, partial [Cladochytrium tenue]